MENISITGIALLLILAIKLDISGRSMKQLYARKRIFSYIASQGATLIITWSIQLDIQIDNFTKV